MKEIKIEVPTGYKVKGFNSETNTIEFEKETNLLTEMVEKYNINTEGLGQDEIAFKILKKIVKEVNGDWIADFKNSNQPKCYPYFKMDEFTHHYCTWDGSNSSAPASLVFKSEDLCKQTLEKYLEIYKIYFNGSNN